MKYRNLNQTDIKVSNICLGTMTYGVQNDIKDAFEQMDYAIDNGVNFFDTAEFYSVPAVSKETFGETERQIGAWFKERKNRDKIVLATKVMGPTKGLGYSIETRVNPDPLSPSTIKKAVDKSLARLETDYIDLYQIHWPIRQANFLGRLNYEHTEDDFDVEKQIYDTLKTLDELVKSGKIRHIGLSNETAWGTMKYISIAKENNFASPITIQNPYSLVNRTFEQSLAEVSMREDVGLLSYSPLAFGYLTGKHLNAVQENTRIKFFPHLFTRYNSVSCQKSIAMYCELANKHGMTPTELALGFINNQPFNTSTIIGSTKMKQLIECLNCAEITLNHDIIKEINEIHSLHTYPAP